MATSNELRAWAHTLKLWSEAVATSEVHEHILQLAAEFERLAEYKEVAERQLV